MVVAGVVSEVDVVPIVVVIGTTVVDVDVLVVLVVGQLLPFSSDWHSGAEQA